MSHAPQALALVEQLQSSLVAALPGRFEPRSWLRNEGRNGGGTRFVARSEDVFDRASINVSAVHYAQDPAKRLLTATALSAIVHPRSPFAPSVHLHASYTELRDGQGYWRIMADLNPAIPNPTHTSAFEAMLEQVAGPWVAQGRSQGNRYFFIPALGRTRGVVHFYLEAHDTGDFAANLALARRFVEAVSGVYPTFLAPHPEPDAAALQAQLAYHTLYLFQVLTLDRGTTSGLLAHTDNDVGILGSLPSRVDPQLLASWTLPPPQDALIASLVAVIGDGSIHEERKRQLARVVRDHYRAHPEALKLQARGPVLPPTHAGR